MTSLKKCAGDVFLIIYLLICTFTENSYCNKNDKETYQQNVFNRRLIEELTSNNRTSNKNEINFVQLSTVDHQSLSSNDTPSTIIQRHNIKCCCNTTELSSESTPTVDCYNDIDNANEDSAQDDKNNKIFKLNYSRNKVNETIYLNVNFQNFTDRQRRDVIDESSTSNFGGLHGKWNQAICSYFCVDLLKTLLLPLLIWY